MSLLTTLHSYQHKKYKYGEMYLLNYQVKLIICLLSSVLIAFNRTAPGSENEGEAKYLANTAAAPFSPHESGNPVRILPTYLKNIFNYIELVDTSVLVSIRIYLFY